MPYKTPWLKDKNAGIVKIRNAVGDTTTQTGNPVSVDNEFGLGEVDSLSVALSPQQNLNGYDSPWVGGAGKNKFKLLQSVTGTANGITVTGNADTQVWSITGTNTKTDSAYIASFNSYTKFALPEFVAGKTIYLYFNLPVGAYINVVYKNTNDATVGFDITGGSGGTGEYKAGSFVVPETFATLYQIQIGIFKTATTINATDIHFAFGDEPFTEWTPYENICPIYPANGKNLLPTNLKYQKASTQVALGTTGSYIHVDRGQYTLSVYFTENVTGWSLYYLLEGGSATRIDNSGTFSLDTSGNYLFYVYKSGGLSVDLVDKWQLEQGDKATAYVPYQSVVVKQTGKNLIPHETGLSASGGITFTDNVDGSITTNGVATAQSNNRYLYSLENMQKLEKGVRYRLSGCPEGGSNSTYKLQIWDSTAQTYLAQDYGSGTEFVLPDDDHNRRVRFVIYANADMTGKTFYPMITVADADPTYEPCNETNYPMALGQDAYGGSIDLATGVLTVDKGIVDMGTLTWYLDANRPGVFYSSTLYEIRKTDGYIIADIYKNRSTGVPPASQLASADNSISLYQSYGGGYVYVINTSCAGMTREEFKTAMSGFSCCYELKEPQTYNLTPQQIELLRGMNYISSSDDITLTVTLPGWTSLIDPSKIKHDIYDLDAGNTTGRNLAGEMLRDRVAVKEKLNMEFPPMVADDYYAMLNLIKDQFFDVQYYSPFTGGKRVATMYVGDREGEPYYDYDVNDHKNNMWTNVKFNFIER